MPNVKCAPRSFVHACQLSPQPFNVWQSVCPDNQCVFINYGAFALLPWFVLKAFVTLPYYVPQNFSTVTHFFNLVWHVVLLAYHCSLIYALDETWFNSFLRTNDFSATSTKKYSLPTRLVATNHQWLDLWRLPNMHVTTCCSILCTLIYCSRFWQKMDELVHVVND